MRPDDPRLNPEYRRTNSRAGRRAMLPILMFGIIALVIASKEIPMVHDFVQSVIAPQQHQAAQTCRQEAMQLSRKPAYARVVRQGQVHSTQEGFYVEGLVIGEMGEQGGEVRFAVDCYTDSEGRLVRADRVE